MMRVNRAFDMLALFTSLMVLLTGSAIYSQTPRDRLKAGVTDPIYTTYAADRERSEYLVDEGYHLVFYHEGQVFYESISMLTYVYIDPQGAMDSQRIFIERQQEDGFIGNGPVWLLWNYFVFRGLLDYGYKDLGSEVVSKVMEAVTYQLRKNHHFWESYSPDYSTLESPPSYIWDCIIARMMIDLQEK